VNKLKLVIVEKKIKKVDVFHSVSVQRKQIEKGYWKMEKNGVSLSLSLSIYLVQ